jgi:hypothetical protein
MIVELLPFDLETSAETALVQMAGFFEALPRLCGEARPAARLLFLSDRLRAEAALEGFRRVVTPEALLPPGVLAYRLEYESFLRSIVAQELRYLRAYLVTHPQSLSDEEMLVSLLGAYGVRARVLDHAVLRPFDSGRDRWDCIEAQKEETDEKLFYVLLASAADQHQALIHPRTLHGLFTQDFPIYAALNIYTYPPAETTRLLNLKAAAALYGGGKTLSSVQEAARAQSGVQVVSEALANGEALHLVRLYVLVPGSSKHEAQTRAEIVRGALGLRLQKVFAPGRVAAAVFSADALEEIEGTPMTTSGAALLAGSGLSYRRRTEMQGVLLGVDRNQSPVVVDLFNDRHPSYNMTVLGRTGSGKTFAMLTLMLRHLLMGVRLIIIDPQGNIDLSFLGEGVYQKVRVGTAQARLNVLDMVHEELSAQVEQATALMRLLGIHSGTALERALLDEALSDLYAPRFPQGEPPLLGDLYEWMRARVGRAQSVAVRDTADALSVALQAYVTGSRAAIFGARTSVDFALEHAVNVFDVSNLPMQGVDENLRSALLAILVANINRGIRRRRLAGDRAPMLFFIDEMGVLMRDSVLAGFVSAEFKTARARLVGMVVADQDLHSLLGPRDEKGIHHGLPILANSANLLLFRQNDNQKAIIREYFPNLPQALLETLTVLPRGSCVTQLADDDLLVVDVLPSAMDRIVLSSRLQDRQRAQEIVRRISEEVSG